MTLLGCLCLASVVLGPIIVFALRLATRSRATGVQLQPYQVRVMAGPPALRVCPYCRAAFAEKPAKPRKCRSCGATITYRDHVPMTEEQARAVDHERFVQQHREARAQVLAELKRDRTSGVIRAYKIEVDGDCCSYCWKLRNKVIPLARCTPEMLPPFPFEKCECEDGCQAWYSAVLK